MFFKKQYASIGIILLTSILIIFQISSCKKEEFIHIGFAGPMSGKEAAAGRFMTQAVELYIDSINKNGGVNGKKIILDKFDDQNNPDQAEKTALKIVKENQVLAVIGHWYSSCSIRAGKIYKEHKIPAITPAAIMPEVTLDNDWYFRTIYNLNTPARLLVYYIRHILKYRHVYIIHEDSNYKALALCFTENAKRTEQPTHCMWENTQQKELFVRHIWEFSTDSNNLDNRLKQIINELGVNYKQNQVIDELKSQDIIFMSVQASEGAKLIKLLRDAGIRIPVIGPSSFSEKFFIELIKNFPKEKNYPGYYTNGIYVATPLLFDIASKEANDLKTLYKNRYNEQPDWSVAFAYDAAKLIIEAIKNADINKKQNIAESRQKIRDWLAGCDRVENAIKGATGLNYFDKNGDPEKPISIGVYRNNNIISALAQLKPVHYANSASNIEDAIAKKYIIPADESYMYKTNIVYTGMEINEIGELDLENLSYMMDFYIWFRYNGDINPQNIEFLNSVHPIDLINPSKEQDTKVIAKLVSKETRGSMTSQRYHIKARFKTNADIGQYNYQQYQIIGVSFRHKELSRDNLIYVTDNLGMGISKAFSFAERIKDQSIMPSGFDWTIDTAGFFQDIIEQNTMGQLKYLKNGNKFIEYSRFNFWVRIGKETFRFKLREKISEEFTLWLRISNIIMIVLLIIISFNNSLKKFPKSIWVCQTILIVLLLLSIEVTILKTLPIRTMLFYLKFITMIFDSLWWIIPAYLINKALEPFIWMPLQKRNKRPVPNVLRSFPAYIFYSIAVYGIVAHVFNQNINKLMATSGMLAMVVGFIVKSNISDFFAGIIINLGGAFRIGDFVTIGSFEEGRVVDITWRSTSLETWDGAFLTIPNNEVLGAGVHNYSYPNDFYRLELTVYTDSEHKHSRVEKIFLDAVFSVKFVLKNPKPSVRFNRHEESFAVYHVAFTVKGYDRKNFYVTNVWKRIQKHMEYAGIDGKGISSGSNKAVDPVSVLQTIDIFEPFSNEEKTAISKKMQSLHTIATEAFVQDTDNSLFIITEGVMGVWIEHENGKKEEIIRIGPGDVISDKAVLAGISRKLDLIAVTDTCLFEIRKYDIEPLLKAKPKLNESINNILNKREIDMGLHHQVSKIYNFDKETAHSMFVNKTRSFFGLKNPELEEKVYENAERPFYTFPGGLIS